MAALRNLAIGHSAWPDASTSPKPPDGPDAPWTAASPSSDSHHDLGTAVVQNHTGSDDFILITEARRFGDITDVPDFATVGPLLLMSRRNKNDPFTALVDNSSRYVL